MDMAQLQELVSQGENLHLEFKQDREQRSLDTESLIQAVVGLANAEGGRLVIGVDNSGVITGISDKNKNLSHGDSARLEGYVRNKTIPSLPVTVNYIESGMVRVVVIDVPSYDEPVATWNGTYKRRAIGPDGKPVNLVYTVSEMLSKRVMVMEQDYATVPIHRVKMNELSDQEFNDYRHRAVTQGDASLANLDNLGILQALRLVTLDKKTPVLTVGAVLLFGTPDTVSRYVQTAEVAFQALDGTLLARNDIRRYPLFRAADFLFSAIEETLAAMATPQSEMTIGMQRIPLPTITAATIRECVANALVHRDYTVLDNVQVQLNATGLRVLSPGGFPRGINLSNLLEETRPRSVALADSFKRVGYVERTGRGVPRMYVEQLRNGRAAPDYSGTTWAQVSVSFAVERADAELALFFHQWESSGRSTLLARDLQAIKAVRELRDPTTEELSERLVLPADTIRTLARRLSDLECLEIRGRGTGRYYVLSPLIRRMTSGVIENIPTTEQVLEAQRALIRDFVRSTGAITRRQAADLCRIAPSTATRVLKTLTEASELQIRGSKRGTHYVLFEAD